MINILLLTTILINSNQGRLEYNKNCIKCHNANPKQHGNIGPELYSTPKEVFYTKVIEGKYPSNYKPKRKSKLMPKFKHLNDKIDDIYEYIKESK